MAELTREGDELVLRLATVEKWEGVRGDLRAPLAAVHQAEVLDHAHGASIDWRGIPLGCAERTAYAHPKPQAAWGPRIRPAGDPKSPSRPSPRGASAAGAPEKGVAPHRLPGAGRPAESRGHLAPALPTVQTARPPRMAFGFKIGTLMPGVVEVATVQGLTRRLFVAVHHATPRGLRIRLDRALGASYDEWIVGCADPEATMTALRLPTGKLFSD